MPLQLQRLQAISRALTSKARIIKPKRHYHFRYASNPMQSKKIKALGAGTLIFSAGVFCDSSLRKKSDKAVIYHFDQLQAFENDKKNAPQLAKNLETVESRKQYHQIVQLLYPESYTTISALYDAFGLSALIQHNIADGPDVATLESIWGTLLSVLPLYCHLIKYFKKDEKINNHEYLSIVQKRLSEEYKKANLGEAPILDQKKIEAQMKELLKMQPYSDIKEISQLFPNMAILMDKHLEEIDAMRQVIRKYHWRINF